MVSEWTRDDLPEMFPDPNVPSHPWCLSPGERRDLAVWLNDNHPKPDRSGVDWKRMYEEAAQQSRDLAARLDMACSRAEAAERERDEWRERAETAEQKYGAERLRYEKIRDHHADESRKWGEKRRGYEDQIAQMESDQTGPAVPAVSRADVEQALRAADSDTSHGDEVTYADLAAVVCRLFGIDQPDPVEAKALEFAALADFELTGREAELLHKVAAHVMEAVMSEQWTPKTYDVRGSYVNSFGEYSDVAEGWFDRWLAEVQRAARAEGWAEAHDCDYVVESACRKHHPNPYETGDRHVDQ